ncbi:MAG TPA: zinc-binding dehydrogenase [Acidobacteriota bacterium]|nr:zinc-binding dehydrogenase [Acidobacteriota bacterium]
MRAVQVVAPGRAEFVDVPKPELKPGFALIRPICLSLCGSDTRMLYHAPRELYPFPPGTTGHEMVGRVVAIDSDNSTVQVGEPVLTLVDGHRSMAEYYLAPADKIFPLPNDRPLEHMVQAQQLGTVVFACKHLPSVLGKSVAVIGQGSAGLWFDFMLRRMGASRVVAIDQHALRLKMAEQYGATDRILNAEDDALEILTEITGGQLVDLVVEAAGTPDAINLAYQLVRREGDILYFGVPQAENILIDYETFYWKYPRVKSICEAQREPEQLSTRLALDLIAGGVLNVAPILTHRFSFEQVLEAYELQKEPGESAIKIVIDMPS